MHIHIVNAPMVHIYQMPGPKIHITPSLASLRHVCIRRLCKIMIFLRISMPKLCKILSWQCLCSFQTIQNCPNYVFENVFQSLTDTTPPSSVPLEWRHMSVVTSSVFDNWTVFLQLFQPNVSANVKCRHDRRYAHENYLSLTIFNQRKASSQIWWQLERSGSQIYFGNGKFRVWSKLLNISYYFLFWGCDSLQS